MILVLMLRVGQVRSHHREEVGEGKESRQKCIQGLLSSLERHYIFNSVDRKFLKADPRAGAESLSSSMSTCQQLSCLTTPPAGHAQKWISNNGKC